MRLRLYFLLPDLASANKIADDLLLARHRRGQRDRRRRRLDTEVGGVGDGAHHVGRLEQLLGRDAPAVQARTSHAALFDDGDVQSRRGSEERGRIAGRSAAENHDVELLGQDGHLPEPAHDGTDQLSRTTPILSGRSPES